MKKMFIGVWLVLLLMVVLAAACTKEGIASTHEMPEPKLFEITSMDGKQIGSIIMEAMPDGAARINVSMKPSSIEGLPAVEPLLTRSGNSSTQEVFAELEQITTKDPVSENRPVVATNGIVLSYDALEKTRVLTLRLEVAGTAQAISEVRLQQ